MEGIVGLWSSVTRNGACTTIQSGLLASHLALSCLLLGPTPTTFYRPTVDTRILGQNLFDFALNKIDQIDATIDRVELLVYIYLYGFYVGGNGALAIKATELAVEAANEGGWLDESSPAWDELEHMQRQRARSVCNCLITVCRSVSVT